MFVALTTGCSGGAAMAHRDGMFHGEKNEPAFKIHLRNGNLPVNGNQFREVGGGICSSTAVPILVFLIMMKNQMNGVQNTQVPGREINVLTNLEWHTF
ncbi:hypothetical protein OIU85_015273 [Salix viminalis]|uniref:Uncharacterized protein n=1 Tax=Salix viminalis TaxID=40686 RepID=A0A9Q0NKJ8_SALVM|nr:hypothetical protein OIU85_015273 [Salix viminalis]